MKQTRPTTPTLLTFERMLDLIFGENWRNEVPAKREQEKKIIKLEKEIAKKLGITWNAVIFWRNTDRIPTYRALQIGEIYKLRRSDVYKIGDYGE